MGERMLCLFSFSDLIKPEVGDVPYIPIAEEPYPYVCRVYHNFHAPRCNEPLILATFAITNLAEQIDGRDHLISLTSLFDFEFSMRCLLLFVFYQGFCIFTHLW